MLCRHFVVYMSPKDPCFSSLSLPRPVLSIFSKCLFRSPAPLQIGLICVYPKVDLSDDMILLQGFHTHYNPLLLLYNNKAEIIIT